MQTSLHCSRLLLIFAAIYGQEMAYKVIDLYAGVGGLSYGFAQDDDFEIIAANEILGSMADAYSRNPPSCQ